MGAAQWRHLLNCAAVESCTPPFLRQRACHALLTCQRELYFLANNRLKALRLYSLTLLTVRRVACFLGTGRVAGRQCTPNARLSHLRVSRPLAAQNSRATSGGSAVSPCTSDSTQRRRSRAAPLSRMNATLVGSGTTLPPAAPLPHAPPVRHETNPEISRALTARSSLISASAW